MYKIEIKNDLYNIAKRIKSIDKNYFILFNKIKKTYEIHNSSQPFSTYSLTIPYAKLDKRTIDYVLKTRKENFDKILKEIELSNNKLDKKINDEIMYRAKYDLAEKLKFINKM